MKKSGRNYSLLDRYRNLGKDLHSRKLSVKNSAQKLLTLTICIPLMLWALGYMASWELTRVRIQQENAAFSALYAPAQETLAPTPLPTEVPTQVPTEVPTEVPTAVPTEIPTEVPTAEPTEQPTEIPTEIPTLAPTNPPSSTPQPTQSPTAVPTEEPMAIAADATIVPLETPNANTVIYAMETPPPTQRAFGDLLSLNPDTVGFLRVGDTLKLPVVHRANDNQYYLDHSFDDHESIGGTLFLDGSNLLVPEDPSLIIYGHNMRNGTMFRPLIHYENLDFLKEHPLVQFDTIYQNRNYVPFAVFTVSANPDSDRYVDIRQFMFDELSWEEYIADMRTQSVHNIPIDVQYGDNVLLLVTCEYTHNNGRFVVALRAQRENETEDELIGRIRAAY